MSKPLYLDPRKDGALVIPEPVKANIILSLSNRRVGLYLTLGWHTWLKSDFRSENPAAIFVDPNITRWQKRHHVGTFNDGDTGSIIMRQWKVIKISDDWKLELPDEVIEVFKRRALFLLLRWQHRIEWFALSFIRN